MKLFIDADRPSLKAPAVRCIDYFRQGRAPIEGSRSLTTRQPLVAEMTAASSCRRRRSPPPGWRRAQDRVYSPNDRQAFVAILRLSDWCRLVPTTPATQGRQRALAVFRLPALVYHGSLDRSSRSCAGVERAATDGLHRSDGQRRTVPGAIRRPRPGARA